LKGLDTNVLVRFLVADDPVQAEAARDFILQEANRGSPCFINLVVLCESIWVLERAYGFSREQIGMVLSNLLISRDFQIQNDEEVREALAIYRAGATGFADVLIGRLNRSSGCDITITFDRKAARLPDFRLLTE